ncbi:MAG: NUDIX domain-containing protein [bacterium]|nr:NUDIX domain-containing protein [bacterium]
MENEKPYTKIGVGVMIFKDRKVLLGKRKSSYAYGEYAFPGGHLEYSESFANCARRETLEEAGIEIENIRFQFLANVKKYHPKHYVHIGVMADWKSGEPKNLELDKCEGWEWRDLNDLPKPLFEFAEISFDSYRTGRNYYDFEK